MEMDGESDSGASESGWWPPDFMEKIKSVSLNPQEESHSSSSWGSLQQSEVSSQTASQLLWATGSYSGPIPSGFYCVIPDKKLKSQFNGFPSLDELKSLDIGSRTEVIVVDMEKDPKLFMLKQLSRTLVKGLNSNPASVIKKLAVLVSDCYKLQSSESKSAKTTLDGTSENRVMLLGQVRHGSCRPRALLFKVLADAVGLESKLVVGMPSDGAVEYVDSYKHLSVVVVLNSVELLVDLMRFPGQLIPFSTKAVLVSHISVAGESDSAENDSCDSPLEPNSPLYGFPERLESESNEQDENIQSFNRRRAESSALAGTSSRNRTSQMPVNSEGRLSLSHSEPNIANAFWRPSQRKTVIERCTANSSPENPLFRARRSMLSGGDTNSLREYGDGVATSRSDGASTSNNRRLRRRSISITPEIGDDIVRAVRAMNETLKQNRLSRDLDNEGLDSYSTGKNNYCELSKNEQIHSTLIKHSNSNANQKSVSLPSSPQMIRGETLTNETSDWRVRDFTSTLNKVLQSSALLKQPLLPYDEWNIDFSELTVGTRVGIGFFGEVFRGIWNGTDVAIKVLVEQDLTAENMEDFCNEISILSRLRHPNVILFLGACMKPPHLSMVTEYMEMGSLYYLIHASGQKKKLTWRRRLKMLRDICRGLMCIHRMKIIHRDLKSANCLVDKHWTVKICDFGLSRVMTDAPLMDNSSAGTPEWMAPELIRNESFTEKCDIFSLGVIMWELCTLNRPWEGVAPVQVVYKVANEGTRLDIPEGPLGKLIADCWAQSDDRPSCQEILTRLHDCEYTLS